MFAQASSGTVIGVDAHEVVVEANPGKGLPGMMLIGLARGAVKESLVRVRAAMVASQINMKGHRLVANLLPAELPKEASALDLALAVTLLASAGHVPLEALKGRRFYGELSLGGGLEAVRGAVLLADLARRKGDRELIVTAQNGSEAAVIPGIRVIGIHSLTELVAYLRGEIEIEPAQPAAEQPRRTVGCFSEVRGQRHVKRALCIAAAGGHNVLLIGPPGSGKTMLARRLPGLLPDLSADECIEVTRIHSAAGLTAHAGLINERPFRAPHHTASEPALCGGGSMPRPGEITLAHRGVLFLDELPEFSRRALESLREPLEEGFIHIARAAWSLKFPANVLLVAAMNPCPCGRFTGDDLRRRGGGAAPCLCSFDQITRYRSRISGPLLDRIDLHVMVDAVPFRDYARSGSGETSEALRAGILAARQKQTTRFAGARVNADMTSAECRRFAPLDDACMGKLERAIDRHGLSARAINRITKVARTITDLDDAGVVGPAQIEEAMSFRLLEHGGMGRAVRAA